MFATAMRSVAGRRPAARAAAGVVIDSRQVIGRFMSAAPAASTSENIKAFKIYRWDPDQKVSFVESRSTD